MSEPTLYDEVPYPGHAFAQTHPDRLATMATLFGLDPAPPAACHVLELGCGDGRNLIPMALGLPGSTFVGIDTSATAIADARALVAELHLDNVTFEERGIEEFAAPPESFDYVMAHGVYSWVDAAVRDALLAVCSRVLAPKGVAFVSYNALPGGSVRQTLRDMVRFALDGIDAPRERMAAARELLAQTSAVWPSGEGLENTIGYQARKLLAHEDALLCHDTLSPNNHVLYLRDFVAHAAEHELRFLAEAEYSEMQTGGLPEDLRARLDAIEDIVAREQLLDFLKQRMFRQTLLCHASATPDQTPHPARLATLAASGPIESSLDETSGRVTFSSAGGGGLTTDHPLLVDALQRIGAAWPGAVAVSDLGEDDESRAVVSEALLPCFAANLVRLHAHPPNPCLIAGDKPRASPLARLQARDRSRMTSLRHTTINLEDELGWRLVPLLDGTRDRAGLVAAMTGADGIAQDDLAADVERSLNTLARVALLMPDECGSYTPAR